MKILKTLFIVWLALLGVLVALFLFENVNKTAAFKKMKRFLDEDNNDKNKGY